MVVIITTKEKFLVFQIKSLITTKTELRDKQGKYEWISAFKFLKYNTNVNHYNDLT